MPYDNKSYHETPEKDNIEFDRRGKEVAIEIMSQSGWKQIPAPEAFSSHDLVMESNGDMLLVEAECRSNDTWRGGYFPYGTMTVPMRKYRSNSKFYVQCSYDQQHAGVVEMPDVHKSVIIRKPVKNRSTGEVSMESFFDVRLDKVTFYRKAPAGKWARNSL